MVYWYSSPGRGILVFAIIVWADECPCAFLAHSSYYSRLGDVSVVVYLDDIVVYGTDPTRVWQETKLVLERLARAGFMINTAKSHFFVSNVKMLGY